MSINIKVKAYYVLHPFNIFLDWSNVKYDWLILTYLSVSMTIKDHKQKNH